MNKSKFAFLCNLNTIFKDRQYAYMWCFTFADMPEIEDVAQRWRHLVNWLVRYFHCFVNALQKCSTDDPAKLKMACAILKKSGQYYCDITRVLLG